jgi:succinate dehydrogenase flavin-adding protein (antitoxin of CptAB toxin-antitoxin module)
MRELDELLLRYFERRYAAAPDAEKAAFAALLELPDPELAAYLLHAQPPESVALVPVIEAILGETAH